MSKMRSVLLLILFLNKVLAETEASVSSTMSLNISKENAEKNILDAARIVIVGSEADLNKTTNETRKGKLKDEVLPTYSDIEQETDLYDNDDLDHEDEEHLKPFGRDIVQKPREIVIRCSRRFTPGACTEPLTTVWTYSFDHQNCTERLGCLPQTYRTNCFKSFNRCNRVCMALSNIYTLILDLDERELHHDDTKRRRLNMPFKENKDAPTLPPLSDSYSDSEGRPIAHEYYDSLDRETLNDDELYTVPIDHDFEVDPGILKDFHSNFNFERLGCLPQTYRTNCFKSFNRCNRVCMALSNIYTLILDLDERELHHDDTKRRRLNMPFKENKDAPTLPPLSDSYSDSEGRPIAHEYYDSLDRETLNDDELYTVPIDHDFEVDPGILKDFHSNFNL